MTIPSLPNRINLAGAMARRLQVTKQAQAQVKRRIKKSRAPRQPAAAELQALELAKSWTREFKRLVLAWWATRPVKLDSYEDDFARSFGELEFAISEKVSEKGLGPELLDLFGTINRHNRAEMSRVLSIDLALTDPHLAPLRNDFVKANVDLITSLAQEQLGAVRDLVHAGVRAQISHEALTDQIIGRFDVTESRARLIARDQVLKQNGQISQVRMQSAGVKSYTWSTAKDERVRGRPGGKWPKGHHWQLEGLVCTWANPPVVDEKTGRREHPGQDYQCRCVAIPNVDELLYAE